MKKFFLLFSLGIAFLFFSCKAGIDIEKTAYTGSIYGNAYFENSSSNDGITVTLEKTDGLKSLSVSSLIDTASGLRTAALGSNLTVTTTDSEGKYSFKNVADGLYTICAFYNNSIQKAVKTNVVVTNGNSVGVEDIILTVTGNVKGKIILEDLENENYGFVVYIAGTSFSAMTDKDGSFLISGIPSGEGYHIVIQKGKLTYFKDIPITVPANGTIDVGTEKFTALEIEGVPAEKGDDGKSIVWKGEYTAAPESPEYLWAYYNTIDGCSYIYDGKKWTLLISNWKAEDYAIISYESEYGTVPSMKLIKKGTKISADYLPELTTDEEVIFVGWYISEASEKIINGNFEIVDSTVFKAKWQKLYRVEYVTGNGETIPSINKVKYGDFLSNNNIPNLERYGYNFQGWYTDSVFSNAFTVSSPITSNITLYAKWTPKRTRIEYVINQDNVDLPDNAPEFHYFGTATELPVPVTSREYYKWILEGEETIIHVIPADQYFESIVLVCQVYDCEGEEQIIKNGNIILSCRDGIWESVECEYAAYIDDDGKGYCIERAACNFDEVYDEATNGCLVN